MNSLRVVLGRAGERILRRVNSTRGESDLKFESLIISLARAIAASGDHRVTLPTDAKRLGKDPKQIKIGFFGNIANNAYNFTNCLRRLGYDAELVIEDGFFDAFLLNRPFWEDMEIECSSYEEGLLHENGWVQPSYVRRVVYDKALHDRFERRYSAIPEVQERYRNEFGIDLPADRALLLAQQMGHWPYLLAMKRYDVIQFSGAPISMGPFCPRPYVVFPTGSDLFISPFEENLFGLLMRAGYRQAAHILVPETNYPEYLGRLGWLSAVTFAPLMLDTETYAPGDGTETRTEWARRAGGTKFLLSACRQSWEWKGNDRLVRAFETFTKTAGQDWRLVLLEWGQDVEATKRLIEDLGLGNRVIWEKLSSKPRLRKLQQAAHLVADQFVMEGYGTTVLEGMSAGKPIILTSRRTRSRAYPMGPPPFIAASSPDEIHAALIQACNDGFITERGRESLDWVRNHHGYLAIAPVYVTAYLRALGLESAPLASADREVCVRQVSQVSQNSDLADIQGLLNHITQLHRHLRQDIMEKYDRSLPLADELTDRWERARYLGFGEGSSIYDNVLVIGNVKVGKNTWIGPGCILDGSGGLEIGSNCSVAAGAHIYSHDTIEWALSGGVQGYKRSPTKVGDACYIGPYSVITAGVTVGNHCLIGALSLVTGDVSDNTFVAGTPATIRGKVEIGENSTITIVS